MELVAELVAQLRRDPLRMALTLFGVVLGAASVVFIASLLDAAGSALSRMDQRATGADITRVEAREYTAQPAKSLRPLRENDLNPMARHAGATSEDSASSTRLMSQEANAGKNRMPVGVQSGGGTWADIAHLELAHGRTITELDDADPVCVMGSEVHAKLFGGVWPLPEDARITLNSDVSIRPVGVFKSRPPMGGGGGDGTWRFDRRIYVGNTLFKRSVMNQSNGVGEIVIRHKPQLDKSLPDLKAMALDLTPLLKRLHLGVANFQFESLNERRQNDVLIVGALAAILLACGLISLIVGGVNVTNSQLVNVVEKTRELAIRRALGASSGAIARGILTETISLTLVGGLLGVGLGIGFGWIIASLLNRFLTEWPFVIVPWSVGVSLVASLMVGLIAGFFPARRASKLAVAECLRDA